MIATPEVEAPEPAPPPMVRPPEAEVKDASVMEAMTSEADAPPELAVAAPEAAVSDAAEMVCPAEAQRDWSSPTVSLAWSTSDWVTPGAWSSTHWKHVV